MAKAARMAASPATEATNRSEGGKLSRSQVLIGLGLALAIVAAAWGLGNRAGVDGLGGGGVNAQYLPKVGEAAPELLMVDASAEPILLSEFRGQPVWINFWASWCDPCKAEFPEIDAAYQRLAPQGVTFLAVNYNDDYAEATRFAAQYGATFPIVFTTSRLAGDQWDVRNFPTHMYIDADGIVRALVTSPLDTETAVARGRQLLSGEAMDDLARA
jgi:thiol-disulfide isomerase/thioredoxin